MKKRSNGGSLEYPKEDEFDDAGLAKQFRIKVRRIPVKFAANRKLTRRAEKRNE